MLNKKILFWPLTGFPISNSSIYYQVGSVQVHVNTLELGIFRAAWVNVETPLKLCI